MTNGRDDRPVRHALTDGIRVRLQRCPTKIHVSLGIQHEYGLCLCRRQLNG